MSVMQAEDIACVAASLLPTKRRTFHCCSAWKRRSQNLQKVADEIEGHFILVLDWAPQHVAASWTASVTAEMPLDLCADRNNVLCTAPEILLATSGCGYIGQVVLWTQPMWDTLSKRFGQSCKRSNRFLLRQE
eukprot:2188891-Amphidinium_carterae.1